MRDSSSVISQCSPSRGPRFGLGSQSPRDRGAEKFRLVMEWMYLWHKTSGPIVQSLLGTTQRDYLARLEKRGLVQSVVAPGLPIGRVWMLTSDGVAVGMEATGEIHPYDIAPSSIDYRDLRHDLVVQRVVRDFVRQQRPVEGKTLARVVPERLLGADRAGQKRPDALVVYRITEEGFQYEESHAIEVELTPKKGRELDQALLAAAQMIEREEVCSVEYFSHSKALLEGYRSVLARPLNVWVKNERAKRWEVDRSWQVPFLTADAFEWRHEPGLLQGLSPF